MKKQIISLTTSSLIIFQNGLCMPIVYAQENTPNLVLDTQNPQGMSIVYLGDADGNMDEGDGTLKKPYQNIRTALNNVAEGGTIKIVGRISYTKYDSYPYKHNFYIDQHHESCPYLHFFLISEGHHH